MRIIITVTTLGPFMSINFPNYRVITIFVKKNIAFFIGSMSFTSDKGTGSKACMYINKKNKQDM